MLFSFNNENQIRGQLVNIVRRLPSKSNPLPIFGPPGNLDRDSLQIIVDFVSLAETAYLLDNLSPSAALVTRRLKLLDESWGNMDCPHVDPMSSAFWTGLNRVLGISPRSVAPVAEGRFGHDYLELLTGKDILQRDLQGNYKIGTLSLLWLAFPVVIFLTSKAEEIERVEVEASP